MVDRIAIMPGQLTSYDSGGLEIVALRALAPGGTVALAGVHMSDVPQMDYESCLFHEKNLRSVEANTRADGEAMLEEAASIPIRPEITSFPLEQANEALIELQAERGFTPDELGQEGLEVEHLSGLNGISD